MKFSTEPFTADDWTVFLKDGETLRWHGSSSLMYLWPRLTLGVVFFGICGISFADSALNYSSVHDYCSGHVTRSCSREFSFRWPGTLASGVMVLVLALGMIGSAAGWIRHNFALTDSRALQLHQAPWRKPPGKLYQADLATQKAQLDFGQVRFGSSSSGLRFMGLSPDERQTVLSLANNPATADIS